MLMKVYIAAPFFNPAQLAIVEDIELQLKFHMIDFFSPRSEGVLVSMSPEEQKANHKRIYESNVRHMDECTHMVACVEYKDTGTIFEMGYFAAQKKPIVMFSSILLSVNVMLGQSAYAICDNSRYINNALMGLYTVEIPSWT